MLKIIYRLQKKTHEKLPSIQRVNTTKPLEIGKPRKQLQVIRTLTV